MRGLLLAANLGLRWHKATGGLRDLNERSTHLAEQEPELVSSGTDFTARVVTLGISQTILGDAIVIGRKWERVDQGSQLHEPAERFFEGQLNAGQMCNNGIDLVSNLGELVVGRAWVLHDRLLESVVGTGFTW